MEAKLALRHSNLNPDRPDAGFLRTLDTSIKRNTAVIKKLKQINEEQRECIMDELRSVNLSKFVSEAVAAICDSKLRTSDLQAAVQICSLLHQRYMDFSPSLTQGLLKVFLPGKSLDDSDVDKNIKAMKKRCILKLLMELYFVGVIDDSGIFINIIRDIGNVDNLKDRDNTQLNLSLIISFCRQGRIFLGLDVSSETTNEELFKELNITQDQKKIIGKTVHGYHDAATELLQMEHSSLRQLEIENEKILNVKGELSDENALSYEKIRKSYDHLYRAVSSLAEALEMKPPVLPEDSHTTRLRGGEESSSPTSGKDSSAVDSIWDDEDTKAFYESLPDLRAYVPAVLLGETDTKGTNEQSGSGKSHGQSIAEPISKDESSQNATSQDVLDNPTETDTSQEGKSEDIGRDKEEREKEKTKHSEREKGKDKDMDRKGDNEREKLKFVDGSNLDDLLQRLPGCVSRELIDQLTVEFCYFNSKTNRKKLVRALSNVPRTSLELLPYYSRMVAILSTCMKDVSALLLQTLEEEFNFLINKKDQMNIETKIRNIRFIGELCKFKVAPTGFVFSCLKACLDDFTHHSIDVACNLLETCGRFLYRCPETTIRMSNMLDILMRLKNVKNLDPHHNTLVENVYYLCKPPERPTRMSKALSPLNQYIKKLLFSDLDKTSIESVLRQLRKLPWSECEGFILKCFMKVHKGKYNHIHLFASLTAALSHYHDDFSVYVVDEVLEVIRSELELNNYGKQQRRLAYMRFLGELYSYEQLDSSIIFDTLYLVLFFGHGTSEQDTLDPPEDCFRIRMVITLLGTCGHYFDRGSSKRKLDRLLLHLQRYILNKGPLPLDVEFDLQDLLADLRPNMARYRCVEEAMAAITEFDEQERDNADKPRQHSKRGENGPENGERTSTGELGVAADSESESDSCVVGLREEELEESNHGESDDVEESNQGSDRDDEDDNVCVKQMLGEVDPLEKADFERDLHALIQESLESRKLELRSRGTVNMSIPMNIFEGKEGQWGEMGEEDEGGVEVKVLVRKGNKQQTKDMNIPRNCSLVHSTKHKGASQLHQMQDIKRLVLEYNEREEESNGLHSSSSSSPSSWLPPWNGASSTWENDSSKPFASRHRHHYFAAALGSHYTRKK